MSVFRQLMMRKKNIEIYPPSNVVFTKAGQGITLRAADSFTRTWTKDYDGEVYVCGWNRTSNRCCPMAVSTDRNACFFTANDGWGIFPLSVSTTTFYYKGKNWYYATGSQGPIAYPLQQYGGFYIVTEDDPIQCAKALLDYVYNFTVNNISVCDYIETTGTQWIDTRLVPTSNTRVVTTIKTTTTEQAIIIFGCANSALYYYLVPYDNKWYYGLSGSESYAGTYNGIIGQEYEIDFNNNGNIIINNNIIASGISPSGNGNLLISNRNNNLYGKWQYKSFKVYESGVLIRDFIPIYISSIQKYGFLDAVAKNTYLNSGTGDLAGGND